MAERADDSRCPTCGASLDAGASRCPSCGRVLGADNKCPTCQAYAGVFAVGGGYVCAACRAPRERRPNTVVLAGAGDGAALTKRAAGVAQRVFGAGLIATGVLTAALVAIIVSGATGFVLAGVVGGAFVAAGALLLKRGADRSASLETERHRAIEDRILRLARERDGVLTVTEVAERLGVTMTEADVLLTGMTDGTRVTLEINPDGTLRYEFREIKAIGPRVRVEEATADEQVPEEIAAAAEGDRKQRRE